MAWVCLVDVGHRSGRSTGISASTSVLAMDMGRPWKIPTRLDMIIIISEITSLHTTRNPTTR